MKGRQIFLTALLVGFSGAIMPGPLLAVNIEQSMRRGAWAGPLLILGHAVLELALIVAILLGLGRYLRQDKIKGAIGLAGGAVLLWMAAGMLRNAAAGGSYSVGGGASPGGMPLLVAGIVVSLSNPYWTLWWATIGLTHLTRARELPGYGVPVFFAGHILADFVWYTAVAVAVSQGKNLVSTNFHRAIVLICGFFLIGIAVWFVDASLGFLGLRGFGGQRRRRRSKARNATAPETPAESEQILNG